MDSTSRQMAEHRSCIRNQNIEAPMVQHFLDYKHAPNSFKFLILKLDQPQKTVLQPETMLVVKGGVLDI